MGWICLAGSPPSAFPTLLDSDEILLFKCMGLAPQIRKMNDDLVEWHDADRIIIAEDA
jgi:hypothetical protein